MRLQHFKCMNPMVPDSIVLRVILEVFKPLKLSHECILNTRSTITGVPKEKDSYNKFGRR